MQQYIHVEPAYINSVPGTPISDKHYSTILEKIAPDDVRDPDRLEEMDK